MYSNEPTTNKLDSYLANQSEAQFPSQKRVDIFRDKLGKSKPSDELANFQARVHAKQTGKNAMPCEVCSTLVVVRDLRTHPILCSTHQTFKTQVTELLARRKQAHLKPEDIGTLQRERNKKFGSIPQWNKSL